MKAIKLFSMAVAALMMAACSNEDNDVQQPAQTRSLHFVATLAAPNSGAATRTTYTEDGTSINVAWVEGDEIALIHNSKKEVVSVKKVNEDGSATIEGDITGASDGDNVTLAYPASGVGDDGQPTAAAQLLQLQQDGTLAYIQNNLDARMGKGEISVSGSNATLKENVKMASQMAIWKLTLQDNAATPNALSATTLTLTVGTEPVAMAASTGKIVWYISYPVAALYKAGTSGDLTISATVGSDTYTYTKAGGVNLTTSKYYQSTVTMYPMAANATAADLGKLICTAGHIHANAEGADAGCTANRVAMITYVGSDAETSTTYNHGLALSLVDAGTGKNWCDVSNGACLTHQYGSSNLKADVNGIGNTDELMASTTHKHAAAEAARNYNSGNYPTGTSKWFLPSTGQWEKMFGSTGYGIDNLKTSSGAYTAVDVTSTSGYYWSSTEVGAQVAFRYYFGGPNWSNNNKQSNLYRVRACIAF